MCRIFGSIGRREISPSILKKVAQRQLHGGPDYQNFTVNPGWSLGINRLAIQGLDGGLQPFSLRNQIYAVFNGEIYNHRELKKLLNERGYAIEDNCDGAIILPMYLEYGEDFVRFLDGMFAIAIYDASRDPKLILATDPAGIKSLFYYWDAENKTLLFSSEISALLSFEQINQDLRPEGFEEYLFGRTVWGQNTVYKHIHTLEPSSLLIAKLDQYPKINHYHSKLEAEFIPSTIDAAAHNLNTLLQDEVAAMMSADVPVCVITSGGLDSSYLTALASQCTTNLHSFNIWYEGDWPSDERHYASEVAKRYNTQHHQIMIHEHEFSDLLQKTIQHLGQPNTAPHSVSTYALFEAIQQQGFKVALTGDGADEFFGGYTRFAHAEGDEKENWLPHYFDIMSSVTSQLRRTLYSADYKNILYSQTHPEIMVTQQFNQLNKAMNSRLQTLLKFDQYYRFPYYILRRLDHLSMAHSVEARVPFCQPRIMSFAKKIPDNFKISNGSGKYILYKAAKNMLPESVLNRPKQPFTLPIIAMLKKGHALFNLLLDVINSNSFKQRNIFNTDAIKNLVNQQSVAPSSGSADALWSIMVLELWLQMNNSNFAI